MPLLLVDLDNTLIDRAGAFRRWAREFVAARGADADADADADTDGDATAADAGGLADRTGEADVDWLVAADGDGFAPRERVAAMIAGRFGLNGPDEVLAELRAGLVRQLVADEAVARALRKARAAGWTPFVVTNGTVRQQERKLRLSGLANEVAGWVVSEGVGLRKPDPAIFEAAAARAGHPLDGAWMIGDSAEADIEGARAAGLRSVWLHRGRPWPLPTGEPDQVADSFPHAVGLVLGAQRE